MVVGAGWRRMMGCGHGRERWKTEHYSTTTTYLVYLLYYITGNGKRDHIMPLPWDPKIEKQTTNGSSGRAMGGASRAFAPRPRALPY